MWLSQVAMVDSATFEAITATNSLSLIFPIQWYTELCYGVGFCFGSGSEDVFCVGCPCQRQLTSGLPCLREKVYASHVWRFLKTLTLNDCIWLVQLTAVSCQVMYRLAKIPWEWVEWCYWKSNWTLERFKLRVTNRRIRANVHHWATVLYWHLPKSIQYSASKIQWLVCRIRKNATSSCYWHLQIYGQNNQICSSRGAIDLNIKESHSQAFEFTDFEQGFWIWF